MDQSPKNHLEYVDEKVSDNSTEKIAESLGKVVMSWFLEKQDPSFEISKIPIDKLIILVGDFVKKYFPVTQVGSGVHTLGYSLPYEQTHAIELRMKQRKFQSELGHLGNFTPQDLAVSTRYEEDISKNTLELKNVQSRLLMNSVARRIRDVLKAPSLSKMYWTQWAHKNDKSMADMLIKANDRISTKTLAYQIPPGILPVYREYQKEINDQNKHRDCKTTTAICAYVLDCLRTTYSLPIEISFAQIASMPHPYIKISWDDSHHHDHFIDFPAYSDGARINHKEVWFHFERFKGNVPHRYDEFPIDVSGLSKIDTTYLQFLQGNRAS